MKFVIDLLTALILAVFLAALVLGGLAVARELRRPEQAAVVKDGQILRRLEIRLHEPLDKGRGDRYRVFECDEVALDSPRKTP